MLKRDGGQLEGRKWETRLGQEWEMGNDKQVWEVVQKSWMGRDNSELMVLLFTNTTKDDSRFTGV